MGLVRIVVEQCGRVSHRLVEEHLEHVVRQVVVPLDVLAGALDGVVVGLRDPVQDGVSQLLQRGGDQIPHVRGERRQYSRDVVRCPVAGHERLAEADRAARADAMEEIVGTHQPQDGRVDATAAVGAAVRFDDAHRQPVDSVPEQASGHGRAEGLVRNRCDVRPPIGCGARGMRGRRGDRPAGALGARVARGNGRRLDGRGHELFPSCAGRFTPRVWVRRRVRLSVLLYIHLRSYLRDQRFRLRVYCTMPRP